MSKNFIFVAIPLLLFAFTSNGHCNVSPPSWETDYDSAACSARKASKDLLVVFRGPNASPGCKRVNTQILDGAEFRTIAGHQFVLLHALAPDDANRDSDQQTAYGRLLKLFNVTSYPIMLLADQNSNVYGQIRIDNSRDALEILQAVEKQGQRKTFLSALLKKDNASDMTEEKAGELSGLLESLGSEFVVRHHRTIVDKLIAFDQDGKLGLKETWEDRISNATTLRKFNEIYFSIAQELWAIKTASEAVSFIDSTIKDHALDGELRQMFEMQKYLYWGREKNYEKMLEVAEEAKTHSPKSNLGKRISARIVALKKMLSERRSREKSEE